MPEALGALTRLGRVGTALVRASLMTGLQYRSDFVFDGVAGLARTAALAAPLALVYLHADEVMGWAPAEAALVLALFLLMNGVIGGLVEPNLGEVVEAVRTGTLDLVLMKPADAQLLVSLRTVAPSHLWDVLAAALVAGWALPQVGWPTPLDTLVAALLLLLGLGAMYGLWLLTISASFVFVRVDNLRFLLWSVTDAGRWPITVFSGAVRWLLTVAVPVALLTSFPAMALLGRWDAPLLATAVLTGVGFLAASRWVWVRALSRYTSASS